jgi:two-component system, cell cycle response regulator
MTSLPSSIRERVEKCATLPTLPAVALRILELCQHEQLDLGRIASTIASDPALAVKLMKTANSPIFALHREVTTISYAVSLLGVNAIRTLVLSFSLAGKMPVGKQRGLESFWRRSIYSALAARELCQVPLPGLKEEAFLAGLLQDIGMLALSQSLGPRYTRILDAAAGDHAKLAELEQEALGGDHAQVGAWLLERWRVPSKLAEVVGASHSGHLAPLGGDPQEAKLTSLVALSGLFADQWTSDVARAATRLFESVAANPELKACVNIQEINARLNDQAPHIAPLFDVHLEARETEAALAQAQDVLLALSVRASQELTGIHQALARLEARTSTLLAETYQDHLTSVANRGYTASYLEEVFNTATSSKCLIAVIFADVDHFKRINDEHGHAAGDSVLYSVAQTIVRSVRGGDFVGRWGGEEFLIVMGVDNISDLAAVAERVRCAVAQAPHHITGGQVLGVTISLGGALLDPKRHMKPADLLEAADKAMYQAKLAGRNQFRLQQAA